MILTKFIQKTDRLYDNLCSVCLHEGFRLDVRSVSLFQARHRESVCLHEGLRLDVRSVSLFPARHRESVFT